MNKKSIMKNKRVKELWYLDDDVIEKINDNESLKFLDNKKFYKTLWEITLPIYLQLISTTILSIINNVIIRWVNNGDFSAIVTKTNYIYNWVAFLPSFSAAGIFVIIGNFLGQKRKNEIDKILFQGWIFNISICLCLITFLIFFKDFTFNNLVNITDEENKIATPLYYMNLSLLFLNSINVVSQRAESALGNTKILFIIIVSSAIINTLMVISLVFFINPVIATGISNIISTLYITIYVVIINFKHINMSNIFKNNKSCWDIKIFKVMMLISLPTIFETLVFNAAAAFTTFYITSASGNFIHAQKDILLNTLNAVQQITNFGLLMSVAIGQVSSIFIARLIGSNIEVLAKKVSWRCWLTTLYTAMPFSILTIAFCYPLLIIYNIPSDIIWSVGIWLFIIICFQDFGRTMNQVGLSCLRAVHYTVIPVIMAFITLGIFNFGFIALANNLILNGNFVNHDNNFRYLLLLIVVCLIQGLEEITRGGIYLILWNSNIWIKKWNFKKMKEQNLKVIS